MLNCSFTYVLNRFIVCLVFTAILPKDTGNIALTFRRIDIKTSNQKSTGTDYKSANTSSTSEEQVFTAAAAKAKSKDEAKEAAAIQRHNDKVSRRAIAKTTKSSGGKAKAKGDYFAGGAYRWDLDLIDQYAHTNQVALVFAGYQDWLIVNDLANGSAITQQQLFDHIVADFVETSAVNANTGKKEEFTLYTWYDYGRIDANGMVESDPLTSKPYVSVFRQDPIQIVTHYSSGSKDQITKVNFKG